MSFCVSFQTPLLRDCWDKLKETGKLESAIINHVFNDVDKSKKRDLLHMMESYGLIAAFKDVSGDSPDEECYLVPSLLTSLPDNEGKLSPDDPCPLYFNFPKGFLPHGLFYQFVCKLISTCSDLGCKCKPLLHRNFAQFVFGDYTLVIVCGKRSIKVLIILR